jgi:hypothetical protein
MNSRGRGRPAGVSNAETAFFENTIAMTLQAITRMKNLLYATDDPEVLEHAATVMGQLRLIHRALLIEMQARKSQFAEGE